MRNILRLYNELLETAGAQMAALKEGKVEDAVDFQNRRQGIIDNIHSIERKMQHSLSKEKDDHALPGQIKMTIEKILGIDKEIQKIIRAEMGSLSEKLETVQKAKSFCHSAAPRLSGSNLSKNI